MRLNANLLHSFQSSFHLHREDTAPSHASYWQNIWQLNISGIFWGKKFHCLHRPQASNNNEYEFGQIHGSGNRTFRLLVTILHGTYAMSRGKTIHALESNVLSQDLIAKEQKSDSTLQEMMTNTLKNPKLYVHRYYRDKYSDTYMGYRIRANAQLSSSLRNALSGSI